VQLVFQGGYGGSNLAGSGNQILPTFASGQLIVKMKVLKGTFDCSGNLGASAGITKLVHYSLQDSVYPIDALRHRTQAPVEDLRANITHRRHVPVFDAGNRPVRPKLSVSRRRLTRYRTGGKRMPISSCANLARRAQTAEHPNTFTSFRRRDA
jgi:hypothetical protein